MSHPIFSSKFCSAGRKAISDLLKESPTGGNCQRDQVAAVINAALGLVPGKSPHAVDAETVKAAVNNGAFDTKSRAFYCFKGRFGGIREAEVVQPKPKKDEKSAE